MKSCKANEVILCNTKLQNVVIAKATARLFNEVSMQKNKFEYMNSFAIMS